MVFFNRSSAPPQSQRHAGHLKIPTVLLYVNDWGTGAHMVVSDRLSQAFQRRGCKVIIFTDQKTHDHIGGFTHVKGAKEKLIEVIANTEEQKAAFQDTLTKHHPDVMVTEHYPMFNSPAIQIPIRECIALAKEQYPNIQIHGLVRDIPAIKTVEDDVIPLDKTLMLYDSLLVRGDPRIYTYDQHFGADDKGWPRIKDKVHYVGYALDPATAKAPAKHHEIVVTLGGSARGMGEDVALYQNIFRSIAAIEHAHPLRSKRWHFFVGSPELAQILRRETNRLTRTDIKIDSFSKTFEDHLHNADMVICRGGMTAIEAVASNVPTLIIPRTIERYDEQKIRAAKLQELAPMQVSVIAEQDVLLPSQSRELADAIKSTAAKGRIHSAASLAVGGHERAADSIINMFNGKEAVTLGGRGV